MAAPTFPTTAYSQAFGTSSSWVVTITNGFTAGNAVAILITQEQATVRTITSIADNGPGNTYGLIVAKTAGATGEGSAHIYFATAIGAVSAGGTITITFNANSIGSVRIQELSPCTSAGITDTGLDAVSGLNHICGDTGITTAGDVIIFAASDLNGTTGGLTAGANYTRLGTTTTTRSMFQYRTSNTAIGTTDQAPFTDSVNNRIGRGCMAAFYASGGAAGQPAKRRFGGITHRPGQIIPGQQTYSPAQLAEIRREILLRNVRRAA